MPALAELQHLDISYGRDSDRVDLTDPQRRAEMLEALGRALNTWGDPPRWLLDLHDELRERG